MKLFNFFKKQKSETPLPSVRTVDEPAESPYEELINYQEEVNNGGHFQYFINTENTGDLKKEFSALETVLPKILWDNLQNAYKAYLKTDESGESDEILDQCDDIFYENEDEIDRIIDEYTDKL